jgi:ribosomal protein L19E
MSFLVSFGSLSIETQKEENKKGPLSRVGVQKVRLSKSRGSIQKVREAREGLWEDIK